MTNNAKAKRDILHWNALLNSTLQALYRDIANDCCPSDVIAQKKADISLFINTINAAAVSIKS